MGLTFYKGRRVFITGHTGFKGSWMCRVLQNAGADVTGYALDPPTSPALFDILGLAKGMHSVRGDIRSLAGLESALNEAAPEIVIHMAAQPIVRDSYKRPVYTYETNVMGTVNILEAVRQNGHVKSFVNVTTDKVYKNEEWAWGYRENDRLCGFDPYSNSKSCSELVTQSYKNSFFAQGGCAISTARAGNVIGGGDFAPDRIVPDCVRAACAGKKILVRNPYSTRPYQHVLEPVLGYLLLAKRQYEDARFAGNYNFGPEEADCVTTGTLVNEFCQSYKGAEWEAKPDGGPHEANFLKLDCSKSKSVLKWRPTWNFGMAIEKTVGWTKCYASGGNIGAETDRQIKDFLAESAY